MGCRVMLQIEGDLGKHPLVESIIRLKLHFNEVNCRVNRCGLGKENAVDAKRGLLDLNRIETMLSGDWAIDEFEEYAGSSSKDFVIERVGFHD